jgi:hypothetical protein
LDNYGIKYTECFFAHGHISPTGIPFGNYEQTMDEMKNNYKQLENE